MLETQRLNTQLLKTRKEYVEKLKEMELFTLKDLLYYFPRDYRDEQNFAKINDLRTDEVNVISGKVKYISSMVSKRGMVVTRAVVEDETGEIPVIWFNQPYIKQMFFKGSAIILTGKLSFEKGKQSLVSPKYEKPAPVLVHTGRLVPVYPESEAITSKWLREKIISLLPYTKYLEETLPPQILEQEGLVGLSEAVSGVHFPKSEEQLTRARERLAFEELFWLHVSALKRKLEWKKAAANQREPLEALDLEDFYEALPFSLTNAQQRVIQEMLGDFQSFYPMRRLVQGDVGSGKTVLAAAALYLASKNGFQGALMAPTEILARQHYEKLSQLLKPFQLNIQLLIGALTAKEKEEVLRQVATGTCDLVVGTHALIQEGVHFARLGVAVIDEQHRFGVKQREALEAQGMPHVLSLSATPIPRTLALTLYGDQDLSILDELPPGRQEIVTRIVPEEKREDAYIWIKDQIAKGRQIFIVCPLVEESEVLDYKAATEEFERLKNEVFTEESLALLHGRMKSEEKEAVMKEFLEGRVNILVSTSVVEVGIDVPNATIMLIEGAQQFGLAQLHQFRGRVGRGKHQSYCFLFTDHASAESLLRLKYMERHSSGFKLAELDLALRGPGEVYGVRQSGIPDLKMANLGDAEFVERVRKAADRWVAR